MLKSLWNSLVSATEGNNEVNAALMDVGQLKMLVEHFPIGKKLRYYPEYQRDIVFATIIVGYCVNGQYLYSRDAFEMTADGTLTAFLVDPDKQRVPLEKVREICLVVPDTSDMERTLDYYRRANIGRHGQFSRGNAITLLAETSERGIPTVDTQVKKQLKLKDGPYADNGMILLSPELDTLSVNDQRQRQRLHTAVPVDLYLQEGAPPFRCVLADFSESSARLGTSASDNPMPPMAPNDVVTIVFSLGNPACTYMIQGTVFRRADDNSVIRLERLYKEGDFVNFKLMDMVEIKTGLLNYGY
jgi:hypothetical protein